MIKPALDRARSVPAQAALRRGWGIALAAGDAGGRRSRSAQMQPPLPNQDVADPTIELIDPKVMRVCADPRNLPFSNEKGEGLENKLAELFAAKLNKKLDYVYFPQATGFVRMTLAAHRCDVIMGFPQGDDLVQNTNPYYRTAYALVAKPGSGLAGVESLADPRLKGKRLGVVAGTPPATNMSANGLMTEAKPYPLMVDTRVESSAAAMIKDIVAGSIDAGVLWGPMAGYYAKQSDPPLQVDAAGEGTRRPAHELSHRHGRASGGPELEAAAQPADPGEPARDQPDPARLRRAAARRQRPADHRGARRRKAMSARNAMRRAA